VIVYVQFAKTSVGADPAAVPISTQQNWQHIHHDCRNGSRNSTYRN